MSPIYVPGKVVLRKDYIPLDANYSNVSLLLHGDGPNGSTIITDNSPSPKVVAAVGNAQISTAQSKFGGSSIAFDGSGDRLTLPSPVPLDLRLGDVDFTIEFWVYTNGSATYAVVGNLDDNDGTGHYWVILNSLSGGLHTVQFGAPPQTNRFGASTLTTSTWHHIAITRNGTSLRCFLNGTQLGSTLTQANWVGTNAYATPYWIGASYHNFIGQNYQLNGYIDDLRITKGVARYTSNFTSPTEPFPNGVNG
jgi:hypothetical protein